jgi:hypothetical protein
LLATRISALARIKPGRSQNRRDQGESDNHPAGTPAQHHQVRQPGWGQFMPRQRERRTPPILATR